jgi:hypothetical protein
VEQTSVVLVRGETEVASWLLRGAACPDLAVVDGLARLLLVSRRLGYTIRLRGASTDLLQLLELAGLAGIVTCCRGDL